MICSRDKHFILVHIRVFTSKTNCPGETLKPKLGRWGRREVDCHSTVIREVSQLLGHAKAPEATGQGRLFHAMVHYEGQLTVGRDNKYPTCGLGTRRHYAGCSLIEGLTAGDCA